MTLEIQVLAWDRHKKSGRVILDTDNWISNDNLIYKKNLHRFSSTQKDYMITKKFDNINMDSTIVNQCSDIY